MTPQNILIARRLAIPAAGMGLRSTQAFASLAVSMVLTRLLSPDAFGIVSAYLSIAGLMSIVLEYGMGTLVLRSAAADGFASDLARDTRKTFEGLILASLGIVPGALLLAGLLGVLHSEMAVLYCLTFCQAVALAVVRFRTQDLRGVSRPLWASICDGTLPQTLMLVFLSLFLFLWDGPEAFEKYAALICITAGWTGAVVAATVVRRSTTSGTDLYGRVRMNLLPKGSSFMLAGFLMALMPATGLFIAGALSGAAELGFYRIAMQISLFLTFGNQAMIGLYSARIATLISQGHHVELQSLTLKTSSLAAIFALPILLPFTFFGEDILRWFYGEAYIAAAPLLKILFIGYLIQILAGPVSPILTMGGDEKVFSRLCLQALIIAGIACLGLGLLLGSVGVALGTTIAMSSISIRGWFHIRSKYGFSAGVLGIRGA